MKYIKINKNKFILIFSVMLICLVSSHIFSTNIVAQTKKLDEPYIVEYYYKTKWGFAEEFITLFKKNHYPILQKQKENGRILQLTAVKPRYHATEDSRWDYRVTIVFKNIEAAFGDSSEADIVKRLYPDQETFKKEESRRFEILLGHWDVPLIPLDLDK